MELQSVLQKYKVQLLSKNYFFKLKWKGIRIIKNISLLKFWCEDTGYEIPSSKFNVVYLCKHRGSYDEHKIFGDIHNVEGFLEKEKIGKINSLYFWNRARVETEIIREFRLELQTLICIK